MSLVATAPVWGEASQRPASMPLPAQAQVVIVGAGLAGSAVALFLAEAGWAPVVIEARSSPGQALSGRDTGLSLPVLNDTPHRLITALGLPGAVQVVRFSQASLALGASLGLLEQTGALMAAGIPQETAQHPIDAQALQHLGIEAEPWTPEEVAARSGCAGFGPGLWVPEGGIMASDAATQLALRAEAAGACFVFDAPVTGLGGGGASTQVLTESGSIATDVVILATGHRLAQVESWFEDKTYPVRAQLLATAALQEPLPFPIRTQLGHAQLVPGPDQRLVSTGCRWATPHLEAGEADDSVVSSAVHDKLWELTVRHRPGAPAPTHQWSGIMCFTCDGLPLLGPIPGRSRILSCAGFAGHQAALGLGAARAVADGLLGEDHIAVPDLFSLARFV